MTSHSYFNSYCESIEFRIRLVSHVTGVEILFIFVDCSLQIVFIEVNPTAI